MNKLILTGRLCRDLELKKTNSGVSIANGTIAFDSERKDSSGEHPTTFLDISSFGGLAEYLVKNARKGDLLEVCGHLESRSYTDRNNNKVTKYECAIEFARVLIRKNTAVSTTTSLLAGDSEDLEDEEEPVTSNTSELQMQDDDLPF